MTIDVFLYREHIPLKLNLSFHQLFESLAQISERDWIEIYDYRFV